VSNWSFRKWTTPGGRRVPDRSPLEGTSPIRPIENLDLFASLVEHDSGDVDAIAQRVTDKLASTIAQGLGAVSGAPGEAVADSESFKEEMKTAMETRHFQG
jgi:hypothetical protein